MKKPQTDFDYMQSLLGDFFSERAIRTSLRLIVDQEITGWEIWLQVEFARFLSQHESAPSWYRECQVEFDYRREKQRYSFKPDFIIRKKHWSLDRYVALEMKQHAQPGNCLSNMVSDLVKVAKMRKSELDIRSIWALGIYRNDADADVHKMIASKLSASGQPYYEDRTVVERIQRTDFSYALF